MKFDILVVGIGGQGVMTAADVLARTALSCGFDACKTEIAGMSQRGGIVSSQVRIADRVLASEVTRGDVDLLLALEVAEALRWGHWLRPGGRAIVNTLRAVPPIVSSGRAHYPRDPLADLRERGHDGRGIDAGAIARDLGDARLANTVLLGSAASSLPLDTDALIASVLERFDDRPALRRLNEAAFDAGRTASQERGTTAVV